MLYFDTHAHYDWEEFDKDREKLFEKFSKELSGIVNIGINYESSKKVIDYSKNNEIMYFSIGIHPMEASKNVDINKIEDLIKENINNKLVAIGETGLDYHFDYPRDLQNKYFIEQIKLANKYNLPIIIHSRESHDDVLKILTENKVNNAGIMHCYSGSPNMVEKFLNLGFYIGVGGPVTRYEDIQESVRRTPMDRIVLETDSPVLPPVQFEKHSRNNSLYLPYVISLIAKIKHISEEDIIKITNENAYKIYKIK
jgi:hydrolase, tatD family